MGQSAGTGSPIFFRCQRCRKKCMKWTGRYYRPTCKHAVTLTGAWKAKKFKLGVRSSHASVQYRCECGHTGWSNHKDLERRAVKEGMIPADYEARR